MFRQPRSDAPDARTRTAVKTVAEFYQRWSLANRNYEALRGAAEFARVDLWYNVKGFFKNWLNLLGIFAFAFVVFVAIIAPSFTQDPGLRDPANAHVQPFTAGTDGVFHWLGTDLYGSDMLARLVNGLSFSLGLGAMATVIEILLGVLIGVLQGYFDSVDRYVRWFTKILSTIPGLLILIVIAVALKASFWTIVLGISVTGWIGMSYYVRAQVRRLRGEDFVTASRILGARPARIVRSLLPMLSSLIISQLLLSFSYSVLADSALAIVGLSIPNVSSLGVIVANSTQTIAVFPLEIVWPLAAVVVLVASVQLIGNGIQTQVARAG